MFEFSQDLFLLFSLEIMADKLTEDDCRVPKQGDKVYKDECILSFDSPESENGIFISLKTFVGIGKKFVEMYHKRTDSRAFLNHRVVRKRKPKKEDGELNVNRTLFDKHLICP